MQHGTHNVGEYPNRTVSDSIRLWVVSYQGVELNSFLLVDLPHLSHQFARVVRHDFAHPFPGFVLCGSFEYLEASGASDLSCNGRVYTA